MSGEPHVGGEAQAAVALGRAVEALQRLPDQPRLAAERSGGACGGVRPAASSASSPKVKVRAAVDDEAVGGVAFGRRSTFQRSAAAPTSIARAIAAASRSGCSNARTEVEPAVMRMPSGQPSSLGQRIGIGGASGAGSTATVSHAAPSSSATICGSAVQMPCPVSACGTATVTRPSRPILMKCAERLLALRRREVAAPGGAATARKRRSGRRRRRRRSAGSAGRVQAFNARTAPSAHAGRSCPCRAAAAARPRR